MAVHKILRTYRFIDKDPVKDEMQTALQDEGLFSKKGLRQVAILSNLSFSTIDALFFGETRRPQNATVMGIMSSIGYKRTWSKDRKLNLEEELEFARAWNKKEAARLERERAKEPPSKRKRARKTKTKAKGGKAA
jgi:hypothetical protein